MKLILQILFILTIVATVSICAIQPDMHKNVIVYDSAYTIVPEDEVKTETQEIPIMEKEVTPQKTVTHTEKAVEQIPQKQTKIETKVQQKTVTTPKQTTTVKKQTSTAPATTVVKQAEKPVETVVKEVKKVEQPKVEQKVITKPVQTPVTLTQQQEEIAWNIWRSNLMNKIMQDTKLPIIPTGIVFKFTFDVDKYGKVSNVQTWSTTPAYTPYAIQYIAPVIRSYQGRDILKFPQGTARITTTVKGGWKISDNEKYSTPNDYNDVERVVR